MCIDLVFLWIILYKVTTCAGLRWDQVRCSTDTELRVPEGITSDIGRFPWLGVVQHNFYLGGSMHFAVTAGILIHPGFVIAPAEDIARINPDHFVNSTKFIVWQSRSRKYVMDIVYYHIHPEFEEKTLATLALLQLHTHGETGLGEFSAPVLSVCLPVKGGGAFKDLYAVKMTDESADLAKEVYPMNFVENPDCEEFYYRAKLNYKKMAPVTSICAASAYHNSSCIWDGGAALITRQTWGYWKLLGFSVRGPGCAAPARFLNIHNYLSWIDETITNAPNPLEQEGMVFRRVTPIKIVMYKTKISVPNAYGQCERKSRGNVLYKDTTEITVNKNFGQGFFFLSMAQAAEVRCGTVQLDVSARTNAAIWVENHCHRDLSADRVFFKDIRPTECFVYFQSVAFVEFRFYFSFKAQIEVTLYGNEETVKLLPNQYAFTEATYPWVPTFVYFRQHNFLPYYSWLWYQ